MSKNKGRLPKPAISKGDYLQIRLDSAEKQTFADAAALSGQSVSVWVRDRLRKAARLELEEAGKKVEFLAGS